jgi:MOSC domain-containing protein YiiM
MWSGKVESIHIAAAAKAPMQAVQEVQAIAGVGLEGDRYANRQGTFFKPEPDFELTLIEAEALEGMAREYGTHLDAGNARRNLVTRGVPLNHLVGREFKVGEALLRGIRLCEPCSHLQALTGLPVIKGLRHRGGLRAQVLSGGTIRVGDGVILEMTQTNAVPMQANQSH